MKNKIIVGVMVLVAFVVGYFVGDSSAVNEMNQAIDNQIVAQDKADDLELEDEEIESELPIKLEDVAPEITIREADSAGNVYMDATFTNNTNYPITGYNMKILRKDSNETGYLSTHDTIMPGETSPKFNGFGPKTGIEDDYEILTLDVRAKKENNKILSIEYDYKLNRAEWSEYEE